MHLAVFVLTWAIESVNLLAKARMAAELNIIYELMLFLVLVPGTLEAAILLAVMVRELNDL